MNLSKYQDIDVDSMGASQLNQLKHSLECDISWTENSVEEDPHLYNTKEVEFILDRYSKLHDLATQRILLLKSNV